MEMMKYKLGDVCTFINGRAYSQPELLDSGKYKVLRVGNIFDGNHWYYSDMELEEDKYCNEGDLLYSWACTFGPYIWHGPKTIYHYHIWKVKQNDSLVDKSFLYYFLNHQTKGFMGSTHGSTMIHITKENMENFEVLLPSLKDQKKIASVLSALDDKIALNKKMNQKLETMAKRLYDYWFVQYDFPDKNGHPYKTTGGPMTYNPTLKREIPVGWEVCSFGDCVQLVSNRVDSRDVKKDDFYTPIEVIPKRQMSLDECAPIEDATSGLCSYDKKDILLSNRRVYFHKVCIAPFSGLTRDTVIIFRPKTTENLGFVYQVVNSDHFIEYATVNSYGSEQPVLSWPTVQNYKIVKPPQKIMLEYSERVKDIIDHVLNIQLENIKLKNMRDKLLPLLMNGQVEVK